MLRHEFLEKQNSRVDVKEIDGETMELLLSYIYTGQVCLNIFLYRSSVQLSFSFLISALDRFVNAFENCHQIDFLGHRLQECLCGGAFQGSRQVTSPSYCMAKYVCHIQHGNKKMMQIKPSQSA